MNLTIFLLEIQSENQEVFLSCLHQESWSTGYCVDCLFSDRGGQREWNQFILAQPDNGAEHNPFLCDNSQNPQPLLDRSGQYPGNWFGPNKQRTRINPGYLSIHKMYSSNIYKLIYFIASASIFCKTAYIFCYVLCVNETSYSWPRLVSDKIWELLWK